MIRNWKNSESFDFYLTPGLWQSCLTLRALKQVHGAMVVNGFNSSNFALRQFVFVAAIVVGNGIHYAHKVFDHITQPDFFIWNTMIKGSASSPNPENAVRLYGQMGRRGFTPSFIAHQYAIKACAELSWVGSGSGLHGKVVKSGLFGDFRVRNSLIYFHSHCGDSIAAREIFDSLPVRDFAAAACLMRGYAKRGRMDCAGKVFDEMPEPNAVCSNVAITGYAANGDTERARRVFDEAPTKNAETWNALISGHVARGENLAALRVFEEMRRAGEEEPNEVTFLGVLSACSSLGYLRIGKWIHGCVVEMSSGDYSVPIGNALVRMYSNCGSVETAIEVFSGMKEKDTVTWNSMMRCFLSHGRAEEVFDLFKEMSRSKFRPDEITFMEILVACCRTGRVDEGIGHFNLMRIKFEIEPNVKHYSCLVDMFGRAGMFDEAVKLIETMEVEPNDKVWRYLVRACRIHGNVELGKYARGQLLRSRTTDSGR